MLNGILLYLVALFVPGITIAHFGTAILAAVLVSLVSWFAGGVLRLALR